MTDPMTDLEDRLRAAVRAEAAGVHPDDASLGTIRSRVRTARRRRRTMLGGVALAVLVLAVVAVPVLGRDLDKVSVGNGPKPTATTTEPPPGPSTTTPSPGTAPIDLDRAMWPDPNDELFTDPVDAVRSFVKQVIGVDDPPLSAPRLVGSRTRDVDVFARGEDGRKLDRVVSTVVVRQLDGEHWFVMSAASDDVIIDLPDASADAFMSLHVTGRGHGFEGTIAVELRQRSRTPKVLADDVTTAGSGGTLESFSVDLNFDVATPAIGILVAHDSPGVERAVPSFSAEPVRLWPGASPGASAGPPQTTTGTAAPAFRYQPLWPFSSQAEADAWIDRYRAQGSQPWHLDAEQTALSFTTGYLGFTEIDRVVARDIGTTEAHVSVGYQTNPGQLSTAANIHLARFGRGADAPWEVVGTSDVDLTLKTPRYGAAVTSPMTVGGHVTGVDECLVVQVRQPSSASAIGMSPECLPAGGQNSPWQTTVSFAGATDPVLTLVVSTGGHFQGVERFAVTAVHG